MTLRIYSSTQYNAPVIKYGIGHLTNAMDIILGNGYGSQQVTISQSLGVAILIFPVRHGISTNVSYMTVSGAVETDYNGEYLMTVVDEFTVSYVITPTAPIIATGTILCKTTGAGWLTEFTGVNERMYKMPGGTGHSIYMKSDEVGDTDLRGFLNPTGLNVGAHSFPSSLANNTFDLDITTENKPNIWHAFVDDDRIIFISAVTSYLSTTATAQFYFGDVTSLRTGTDDYKCVLLDDYTVLSLFTNDVRRLISARYDGTDIANNVAILFDPHTTTGSTSSSTYFGTISDTNKITLFQGYVLESTANGLQHRGKLTGIYSVSHGISFLENGQTFTGIDGEHYIYCFKHAYQLTGL